MKASILAAIHFPAACTLSAGEITVFAAAGLPEALTGIGKVREKKYGSISPPKD